MRTTTWSIPLIYVVATIVVGMVFPRVEHRFLPELVAPVSTSSAIAICSSVSSGMIAMTGIVFTLAFVMAQFSATAYSPRLVLWMARDPMISHALGVFSATFLYSLLLLAWVDRETRGVVPLISGSLVLVLLLASMGVFVGLIHRIGLLQVNRMLLFTGDHGRRAIDDLYPDPATASASAAGIVGLQGLPVTQTICHAGHPQVIQAIHAAELVKLARASGAVVEMIAAVGDTVLELTPLLRVHAARQPLDEHQLLSAIELGDQRTFEQDPKYAIRLVVDIAIKALSPAVNDPTTAVQALDQIEDLLIRLGRRCLEVGDYRDEQGALRLVVPFPTWDDFLRVALEEIRFCGAHSVQVLRRMNALIKNLTEVLPPARHRALQGWQQRLQGTVHRSFADDNEKKDALVADRQGLGIGEE